MKFGTKPASDSEVATAVRDAIAEEAAIDRALDGPMPETRRVSNPDDMGEDTEERITGYSKLSRLVDDDFPFDETQLAAIDGMTQEPYACLTGAAGTGKTTCTKALVDRLVELVELSEVDMRSYWKQDFEPEPDDEYESEDWIPSIAMVSFTGRATQMIKKNFPADWHGNIMTIHRCLGFYPEIYQDWDDESEDYVNKRRFVPSYTADFRLPWDIIIIDEAGMLGLDLWHQLYAAMKPGCRIYMIGDINQLPPVHGKPIFGFALAKWPSWELGKVHRQQGKNNPIVDNAWRVIHGRRPESQGNFQMMELTDPRTKQGATSPRASVMIRAMAPQLVAKGVYDPIRDVIITPINGDKDGSRGRELGQQPLNEMFALQFNPASTNPRYIVDGGRERKNLAVGDKVMATKNDWEAGITNGMTGIIVSIVEHGAYRGDARRFGRVDEVTAYMQTETADLEHVDFCLEDMVSSTDSMNKEKKREKAERGPSSHIITVRFGDEEHGIEIPFQSLSEVGSLMMAYVVTCHKMQGGEAPTIIIILHDSHKAMLYREWLYTAITRASQRCILFYTKQALSTALNKQKIKGSNLQEKVRAFNELIDPKGLFNGGAVNVRLPESTSRALRVTDRAAVPAVQASHMVTKAEAEGGFASLLKKAREKKAESAPEPTVTRTIHVHVHETYIIKEGNDGADKEPPVGDSQPETIDAGDLVAHRGDAGSRDSSGHLASSSRVLCLPAPDKLIRQEGALRILWQIEDSRALRLLPAPTPQPTPVRRFGVKA